MKVKILTLEKHVDSRGWLAEILRAENLSRTEFGQIFITTANPGMVKGNHYHTRKHEWFCVVKGKAKLLLRHRKTGEEKEIIMGDGNLVAVELPLGVSHAIKNIGDDEMFLVVYIDEAYNKDDPDTFPDNILE